MCLCFLIFLNPSPVYCDLLSVGFSSSWTEFPLVFPLLQLHYCVNLLCILLGADDAAAPSAGEEDSMWSGQIWSLQEHLRCPVLLPHPHRAAGCGWRTALWVLMSCRPRLHPTVTSVSEWFPNSFRSFPVFMTAGITMFNYVGWPVQLWVSLSVFQTTPFPTSYWSCLWSHWLFTCPPLRYR